MRVRVCVWCQRTIDRSTLLSLLWAIRTNDKLCDIQYTVVIIDQETRVVSRGQAQDVMRLCVSILFSTHLLHVVS